MSNEISKSKLKKIIQEELKRVLSEQTAAEQEAAEREAAEQERKKRQAYATAKNTAGKKKPIYKSNITYGREMSAYGKNRGKWQAIYLSPLAVHAAIGFAIYEFKRTTKKYQASGRFYSSQVPIIKRNLIPVLNEMKRILQTGGDLRAVLERVAASYQAGSPEWENWFSTVRNMNPAQQRSYSKMAASFIKTGKI